MAIRAVQACWEFISLSDKIILKQIYKLTRNVEGYQQRQRPHSVSRGRQESTIRAFFFGILPEIDLGAVRASNEEVEISLPWV